MLKLEQVALELLEYKVDDIRAKRSVPGVVSSAWELFQHLTKEIALLDGDERKRLERAGRSLRRFSEAPKVARDPKATFGDLTLGGDLPEIPDLDPEFAAGEPEVRREPAVPSDPEEAEELAVLQRLARKVWWNDLDDFVQRTAAGLRAERDRSTARLLYATLRNLARYSRRDTFGGDLNLARFTVVEPIPERADPLVSLNDLDSLAEMVRDIIDLVLNLAAPNSSYPDLDVAEKQSLDYVRRIALAIARDPYAGSLTLAPSKGASSEQIRLAIQELGKERMRDDQRIAQRRELEQRLQAALAYERNLRQLFQQDVTRYVDLVEAFFDRLARYLPTNVGGSASGPQLQGGVLFAINPALRWEQVPPQSSALTVHLKGPVRFTLAGIETAVMGTGNARTLFLQGKELALKPRMTVSVGRRKVHAFLESGYLHLRVSDEARSLAVLVAEALAVLYVLTSDRSRDLLTVLKIAANTVLGEPQELVRRALERIGSLSGVAPSRRQAIEGFIRGSARAAKVTLPENVVLGLVQRFHTAMTVTATDLSVVLENVDQAESAVYQLTGEPLSVEVAGHRLTIRLYQGRGSSGSLVVMLPGQPIGSFTDYLIEPLGDGTLICVKSDQELAVIYVRDLTIADNRTA